MLLFPVLAVAASPWHCADGHGYVAGLAADGHYNVLLPADGPPNGDNPEKWTVVTDDATRNSFTGSYMQVLPDDRDSYNEVHGEGSFTMTGLEFRIRVRAPGRHTLFLRWTGGDSVGGGDSLYVVMKDASSGKAMPAPPTYRPKVASICESGRFAGCCYDRVTHACPCREWGSVGDPMVGPINDPTCPIWVDQPSACSRYGMECLAGHGELELVSRPIWYLFAGQEYGNVMNFDSEPWDGTCEAGGTGTADTGLDLASWDLQAGDYSLVFYPREDGTALDAFYLATPENSAAPNATFRMALGDSTIDGCDGPAARARSEPNGTGGSAPADEKRGSGGTAPNLASGGDGSVSGGVVFLLLVCGALGGACGMCGWVRHQVEMNRSPLAPPKVRFPAVLMWRTPPSVPLREVSVGTLSDSATPYTAPMPPLGGAGAQCQKP